MLSEALARHLDVTVWACALRRHGVCTSNERGERGVRTCNLRRRSHAHHRCSEYSCSSSLLTKIQEGRSVQVCAVEHSAGIVHGILPLKGIMPWTVPALCPAMAFSRKHSASMTAGITDQCRVNDKTRRHFMKKGVVSGRLHARKYFCQSAGCVCHGGDRWDAQFFSPALREAHAGHIVQ